MAGDMSDVIVIAVGGEDEGVVSLGDGDEVSVGKVS